MARIIGKTYFDITATGVRTQYKSSMIPFTDQSGYKITTSQEWAIARKQQSNWETINQLISLRSLPYNISKPIITINNKIRVWSFEFEVDSITTLGTDDDPLGLLTTDSHMVPLITRLTEDKAGLSVINTQDEKDKNTWFLISTLDNTTNGATNG